MSVGVLSVRQFAHPHKRRGMGPNKIFTRGFPSPMSEQVRGGASDVTDPTYSSSEIGEADETIVEVTFSEVVTAPGDDYSTGVTIEYDAVGQTINSGVRQSDQTKVRYTLAAAADPDAVVTWAYSAAAGVITDQASPANDLEDVAAQTATNTVGTHFWFDQTGDSAHLAHI